MHLFLGVRRFTKLTSQTVSEVYTSLLHYGIKLLPENEVALFYSEKRFEENAVKKFLSMSWRK